MKDAQGHGSDQRGAAPLSLYAERALAAIRVAHQEQIARLPKHMTNTDQRQAFTRRVSLLWRP